MQVLVPLTKCADLDRAELEAKVDGIHSRGGTDLAGGFAAGVRMVQSKGNKLKRVMFLTDMESSPDDESSVMAIAEKSAPKIHTTVIGIGVDVSVGTVQRLSSIAGCKVLATCST